MLPISYGDELGILPTVTHRGRATIWNPKIPGGIQLVKLDREDEQEARRTLTCPEHCHKWVAWGRIHCPMIGKAINADRCKRMRKMSLESLRCYLERVWSELDEARRQKRQDREARQLEALRLVQEGQAKAKAEAKAQGKGKRAPGKGTSGGKAGMLPREKAGPQAAISKQQQPKPGQVDHPPVVKGWQGLPRASWTPHGERPDSPLEAENPTASLPE